MTDYKLEAAKAAVGNIKPGQTVGLGAGATIAYLVDMLAADSALAGSLTFASSSFKTAGLLAGRGLNFKSPAYLNHLEVYFDGCDQFDAQLNALKSGGGIHATEKILASMADEFILLGDTSKFSDKLTTKYPLVIEVLPAALQIVLKTLKDEFSPTSLNLRMSSQKDGALISDNGNLLVDIYFNELPPLSELNTRVKMIPGIVEHSLFYRMASKALIAGPDGISVIIPRHAE
ncbi:ribose 5-phosphate isomerase A [Mucilaginibacter psychrotolerans]|nr:ribose 5-phosphate isomerase A [Mucilaginibacter psychrotolerans]